MRPDDLGPDAIARLREALVRADYTADGVLDLIGPVAQTALYRNETVPARRATGGGSRLETLVRLFLLQMAVPEQAAAAALPLEVALAGGLVTRDGGQVRAVLDVRPYDEGFYVVSDIGAGLDGVTRLLRPDHVVGVGGASTTLAEITVRPPVGRALDVGTGCGVQGLHLAGHAEHVVATDVLPRALELARLTAALSGVPLDLREGSLFEPVAGERFDLVVSNPPFVIAPTGRFTYRDSGMRGDEVCRQLIGEAPARLTEGGWFQCLANWVHRDGEDWRDRVGSWLPEGCDAWVIQREVQDPAEYVSLWLHDSGDIRTPEHLALYDAWLDAFATEGVTGVGFGWVTLRRTDASQAAVRVQEWPHPVEQPLGPHLQAWATRQDWLRGRGDDELLSALLRVADDVVQEQVGRPGEEDPEHVLLRQQRGLRRAERVDTVTAGLVGACDGTLSVGQIVDAIAVVLDEDAAVLRRDVPAAVRRLVADGVLEPPR